MKALARMAQRGNFSHRGGFKRFNNANNGYYGFGRNAEQLQSSAGSKRGNSSGRGRGGFNWQRFRDRQVNKNQEASQELKSVAESLGVQIRAAPKLSKVEKQLQDVAPQELSVSNPLLQQLKDACRNISIKHEKRMTQDPLAEPTLSKISVKDSDPKLVQFTENPDEAMQEFRRGLPAFEHRSEIIDGIHNNQVVVLSGETGSGKTTQLPQYILEDHRDRNQPCNIVVTQPRRLTAIGVAERVADELGQRAGGLVGYQIRLDRTASDSTRLLYCTTGVLLRKLLLDPNLKDVTHVILDEAHERNLETDFLMIIVKRLLQKRKDLKVIVMSATLNAEQFSSYFGGNVPTINIQGRMFPVKELYLEDVIEAVNCDANDLVAAPRNKNKNGKKMPQKRRKQNDDNFFQQFQHLLSNSEKPDGSPYSENTLGVIRNGFKLDEIPYPLISKLVQKIIKEIKESNYSPEKNGAILVFLPGWGEIIALNELLQSSLKNDAGACEIMILHSMIGSEQQKQVFKKTDKIKIILSTNIAESSITISEVKYVIDSCKLKEKTYDHDTKIGVLQNAVATKDRLKQRRGRAGRVSNGVCFHLLPRNYALSKNIKEFSEPEMLKTPLENLCLQIKALSNSEHFEDDLDVRSFLREALSPPPIQSVDNALELLSNLGAFKLSESNSQRLTWLGRLLASLPLQPQVGKMLLLSVFFQCTDPVMTLAAILSQKNVFVNPVDKKLQADADRMKLKLAEGVPSDHFTSLNAFNSWEKLQRLNPQEARRFAKEHFMSYNALMSVRDLKWQFKSILEDSGLISKETYSHHQANEFNWSVVKACVVSGMYPNLLRQSGGKRINFFEKDNGRVTAHPASVVAKQMKTLKFKHKFVMYFDKLKTDFSIVVFDMSQISPFPIVFFAGDVSRENITQNNPDVLKIVDEVISRNNGQVDMQYLSRLLKPVIQYKSHELATFLKSNGFEVIEVQKPNMKKPNVTVKSRNEESNVRVKQRLYCQDWIYFDTKQTEMLETVNEAKAALEVILHEKFNSKSSFLDAEIDQFREILCRVIEENAQNDDIPKSRRTGIY